GGVCPLSSLQTIRTLTAGRSLSTACWITPPPSHGRHVVLTRPNGAWRGPHLTARPPCFYRSIAVSVSVLVHGVSALVPTEAPGCDPKSFPCGLSAWSNRTLAGLAEVPVRCPEIAGSHSSLSAR